ncbi:MAG: thermonuclease family protein [Archaeoglobaceae archaeon]
MMRSLGFIALVFLISLCTQSYERALVVEVIDGDTVKLENGELVRLLGINAPEKGQRFYEEAKNRLEDLVKGKEVLMEKDVRDRDKYGRLLRYVYVNGTFVNVLMVKEGLAYAYIVEKLQYEDELRKAEEEAKSLKLGIWSETWDCDKCIGVAYFRWDAEGDDCANPNGEFVVLKNFCRFACDLTSWSISDESKNVFVFPEFILEGEKSVIIYSGCGESNERGLYWCRNATCKAVWNNDGDTLFLMNARGEIVLQYSYGK